MKTSSSSLRNRLHKNMNIDQAYLKSVYNIGYIGIGNYSTAINNKQTKIYTIWKSMLGRCYSKKVQKKQPSYINCNVSEEWHNFQNFAKWYSDNYIENYCLDKDILFKNNKTYSSETCCFVPEEINNLFIKRKNNRGLLPIGITYNKPIKKYISRLNIGNKRIHLGCFNTIDEAFNVYKIEKEKYIKKIANKWKDKISENIYNILYNYNVEITD